MDPNSVKIPNIIRAKIAVVGEPQVGKTSLCQQLSSDGTNFPKNYLMTHCVNIQVKSINIPDTNDVVELYLADCSGREVYSEMLQEFWNNTDFIVAMYDTCKEESFTAISKWVSDLNQTAKGKSGNNKKAETKLTGVLIANKTDLTERRVIAPKVGSDLAQSLGLMYFESSCKDYVGVEEPFYYLANEYHKMHEEQGEELASVA